MQGSIRPTNMHASAKVYIHPLRDQTCFLKLNRISSNIRKHPLFVSSSRMHTDRNSIWTSGINEFQHCCTRWSRHTCYQHDGRSWPPPYSRSFCASMWTTRRLRSVRPHEALKSGHWHTTSPWSRFVATWQMPKVTSERSDNNRIGGRLPCGPSHLCVARKQIGSYKRTSVEACTSRVAGIPTRTHDHHAFDVT
jgi:hypothetical protein